MKKYIFTTFLLLVLAVTPVSASEQTGTLSTGVQTGVTGTVMSNPLANPPAGTYTGAQSVTLTSTGSTAIYYTIDGSTPSCSGAGTLYSGAVSVSASLTLKAIACYPGGAESGVASYDYTIDSGSAPSSGGGGGGGSTGGGGGIVCTSDADFNNDSKVDIFDLNILTTNWGSTTATDTTGDANCDGKVDIFDLNALTTSWTG